jgi:hypothetical protein
VSGQFAAIGASQQRSTLDRWLDRLLIGMAGSVAVVVVGGLAALNGLFESLQFQASCTVFVAIVIQALPFLVLGTAISAGLSVYVPAGTLRAALPRRPVLAVPAAGGVGPGAPGARVRLGAGGPADDGGRDQSGRRVDVHVVGPGDQSGGAGGDVDGIPG